jgi:hypothetical protein
MIWQWLETWRWHTVAATMTHGSGRRWPHRRSHIEAARKKSHVGGVHALTWTENDIGHGTPTVIFLMWRMLPDHWMISFQVAVEYGGQCVPVTQESRDALAWITCVPPHNFSMMWGKPGVATWWKVDRMQQKVGWARGSGGGQRNLGHKPSSVTMLGIIWIEWIIVLRPN